MRNCPVCNSKWENLWTDDNGKTWMTHHCEAIQAIIAWDEHTQMDITDRIIDPPPHLDSTV